MQYCNVLMACPFTCILRDRSVMRKSCAIQVTPRRGSPGSWASPGFSPNPNPPMDVPRPQPTTMRNSLAKCNAIYITMRGCWSSHPERASLARWRPAQRSPRAAGRWPVSSRVNHLCCACWAHAHLRFSAHPALDTTVFPSVQISRRNPNAWDSKPTPRLSEHVYRVVAPICSGQWRWEGRWVVRRSESCAQ